MANTRNPRPLDTILPKLRGLGLNEQEVRLFRDTFTRSDKVLTDKGEIQSVANITGRTEGMGTTVSGLASTGDINATTKVVGRTEGLGVTTGNIDATGKLTSTDAIAADGTGSPLTGGKRGFQAINSSIQLANSFVENPVNVSSTPIGATSLSNNGSSHVIAVAASSQQFGAGQVNYLAGSVDPGAFGTFYIFASDPNFQGGAVTYQFSTTPVALTAGDGLVYFGAITTVSGSSNTGGGNTGGTTGGGGGGGRGSPLAM